LKVKNTSYEEENIRKLDKTVQMVNLQIKIDVQSFLIPIKLMYITRNRFTYYQSVFAHREKKKKK
jgi:hypothetical protein